MFAVTKDISVFITNVKKLSFSIVLMIVTSVKKTQKRTDDHCHLISQTCYDQLQSILKKER